MADVAPPSASATSTADAGKDKAAPPVKPERPDEEQYKSDVAKAEKELRAAEDRMVCPPPSATCMAASLACM